MKIKKLSVYTVILFIAFVSIRCAPNKEVLANRDFYKGDYMSAAEKYKELVDEKYRKKDLSYLIYLMNYAAINHYMGNYREAQRAFWAAYQIQYGKKSTETKAFELVKGTNKRVYTLTKRERALLHFYLGLDFLYLGDLDNSLIEFKKINLIEEQKPKLPLALFYSGKIYEFKNEYDDAAVDFNNMAIVTKKDSNYIPYLELANLYRMTGDREKFEEFFNWAQEMKKLPPRSLSILKNYKRPDEIVILVDVDNLWAVDSIQCFANGEFLGTSILTDAFRPGVTLGEVLRKTVKEMTGYLARNAAKSMLGRIVPGGQIIAKYVIGEGSVENRRWYYAPAGFWLFVTYVNGNLDDIAIKIWKSKKNVKTIELDSTDKRIVGMYNHYFVHLRYQSEPYPDLETIKKRRTW